MSNKPNTLPLGVSSQSTSAQILSSGSPSTQSRFGTQLPTSGRYDSVQGGSSSSFSKASEHFGSVCSLVPSKYVNSPMSSPEAIHNQATSSRTSYRAVSQVGFPSQGELLVSLPLGEATITADCCHSLKLPLVNMLLATPSPFPHHKALPFSLPVS